jgi:tRNA A37 threonylcarbamoyltransferase TsaD
VLVRKSIQAVGVARAGRLVASGGVLCNKTLREELSVACYEAGIQLIVAAPGFCTDNAAMIAGTAAEKMEAGIEPQVNDDIDPNLDLFSPEPGRDLARGLGRAIKLKKRKTQEIPQERPVGAAHKIG